MPDRRDHFAWTAENVTLSQCLLCKHIGKGPHAVCSAFPGGQIPEEILLNEYDHRKPWIDPMTGQPGDEGVPLAGSILFSPKPDLPRVAVARLYEVLDHLAAAES
jgi:hypothetical protein